MQEIAWNYHVGKATVHVVVKEVCTALWNVLLPITLPQPTTGRWERIANEFSERWNMPNCIGAVDGKHITIQAPGKSGSEYFNYKHSFSLVLMATCDADYKFTLVDIGAQGSNHDSAIFGQSAFGNSLLKGELNIPPPKCLPNSNKIVPHFLVGDAAFPLHKNIMRPYPGANLGKEKNIFNYRLSRARRTIENAFGILTQRWRILRRPIIANVETCQLIVQATVVLHNYIKEFEDCKPKNERKYCPSGFVDYIDEQGQVHLGLWREDQQHIRPITRVGANNYSRNIRENRDKLCDYFVSPEGSVPWQEDYVSRGSVPSLID